MLPLYVQTLSNRNLAVLTEEEQKIYNTALDFYAVHKIDETINLLSSIGYMCFMKREGNISRLELRRIK